MSDLLVLFRAPAQCPRCGRSLRDGDGLAVREVDKDYDGLQLRLAQQTHRRIKTGTIVCAVLSVVAALPVVHAFIAPLIFIQTWIWARPLVCAPYARYFSPSRRIVTRCLSRFLVFSLAGLHGHAVIPGVHFATFIASPLIFVVTCGTAWGYHRFHLERERDRRPILLIEKILLVVGALVALAVFAGLIVLALVVGGLVEWLSGS